MPISKEPTLPGSSWPPNVPRRHIGIKQPSPAEDNQKMLLGVGAITLGLIGIAVITWGALQLSDGAELIKTQLIHKSSAFSNSVR